MLVVESFWHEIDEHLPRLERLYEDPGFLDRRLAALVASKVHFYLSSYDLALTYALGAEDLFDITEKSAYVQKIIETCIDTYTSQKASGDKFDPAMEAIVNRMVERCFAEKQFKQALGIAMEARRMDMFVMSIERADNRDEMLSYAFRIIMNFQQNRSFRGKLLRSLIDLYKKAEKPDYVQMVQNLIFLDDAEVVAGILETLSQGAPEDVLMAYQIAFDLYESATQQFVNKVLNAVRKTAPIPSAVMSGAGKKEAIIPEVKIDEAGGEEGEVVEKMETEEMTAKEEAKEDDGALEVKKSIDSLTDQEKVQQTTIEKLTTILSGEKSIYVNLQFLIRNDKSDMLILKQTKDAVRVSVCHYATVVANGFMHCGTTHDSFLRY
jgi:26S proteasome regulatory subunit N2